MNGFAQKSISFYYEETSDEDILVRETYIMTVDIVHDHNQFGKKLALRKAKGSANHVCGADGETLDSLSRTNAECKSGQALSKPVSSGRGRF